MVNRRSKPKVRVFLEGRYRKFVRDLPQTIFYCPQCKGRGCEHCDDFGKLTKDSVQELIQRRVLPRYKARYGKFHGAGREDLDVRMLGPGRPFVYEVVRPKNLIVDLAEVVAAINEYGEGRIEITPLVPVPRKRVAEIKETQSAKVYRALVAVDRILGDAKIEELTGSRLAVVQRTPQRVAHRRADKQRTREVEIRSIANRPGQQASIEVEVCCQHGTYVKEWITGENGRSRPSLAELLGIATHCLALDVWDVVGPFPELENVEPPSFERDVSWPFPASRQDPWALARPSSHLVRHHPVD